MREFLDEQYAHLTRSPSTLSTVPLAAEVIGSLDEALVVLELCATIEHPCHGQGRGGLREEAASVRIVGDLLDHQEPERILLRFDVEETNARSATLDPVLHRAGLDAGAERMHEAFDLEKKLLDVRACILEEGPEARFASRLVPIRAHRVQNIDIIH